MYEGYGWVEAKILGCSEGEGNQDGKKMLDILIAGEVSVAALDRIYRELTVFQLKVADLTE